MSTQKSIDQAILKFPELKLRTSDGHKLRGYFGDFFKEHSSLLHNHLEDGSSIYQYPLVQYKVINGIPILVGLEEGAKVLMKLFLDIKEINIDGQIYPILQKNFEHKQITIGISTQLYQYEFKTLWMALNQNKYEAYINSTLDEKNNLLSKGFANNCLSFFKAFDCWLNPDERIMAYLEWKEAATNFKNNRMIAFKAKATTNVLLPDYIGIGKSVSRGFGCLRNIK